MLNAVNPIMTGIRSIFIVFDLGIYYLLRFVYELFFNIATFNIVDRELIFHLFSRVQLIIGVFMVFQLTMTIIKGIVNPDSFTDAKSGAGNLVMRIMVSLTLLALIVPLNISSPRNEYEKQINNNGILFGTLYSLQYRVLSNNTLGRLILGDDATNYTSSDPDNDSLSDFANRFTSVIVKSFYQLNVDEDGNYVCSDGFDDEYNDEDVSPFTIITHGVTTCDSTLGIGGSYALSMSILSTLAGGIIAVLLFMMTFNVAKRVFQLAALQLMAPIPIISYMDPKGSKDSAFNSWLKLLGSTYLELFIQLAVIYFAFGIIKSFMERFPELLVSTAVTALENDVFTSGTMLEWTFIIMVIALFIFAKDAPKFFKQMLGMKDNGGGFFSAFGTAMGLGATAVGAIGSFNAGRSASRLADLANDRNPNTFGNRAKHLIAGIAGAGKGLAVGSAAASESKGNGLAKTMAAWKAMNQASSEAVQMGASGSTFFGRTAATGAKVIRGAGNTAFDAETRAISQLKDIEKSGKDLFSYLEGKGKTDGAGYNVATAGVTGQANGVDFTNRVFHGSINELLREKQKAIAAQQNGTGDGTFMFDGMRFSTTDASVDKIQEELGYAAGHQWAIQEDAKQSAYDAAKAAHPEWTDEQLSNAGFKQADVGYSQKKKTYNESVKGADFAEGKELSEKYDTTGNPGTVNVADLKKRFRKAGGMATRRESAAAYKKQQADFNATKKNG